MKIALLKYCLLACLLSFAVPSFSQEADKGVQRQVFTTVEQMPSFPGGKNALNKYIKKNLRYPAKSMKHATEGKIVVRFIVEPDGSLTNIEIIRSMNPECDKAALKAVEKMPKWDPGMEKGVFVASYYTLPITFAMH
jgi:protein TonB